MLRSVDRDREVADLDRIANGNPHALHRFLAGRPQCILQVRRLDDADLLPDSTLSAASTVTATTRPGMIARTSTSPPSEATLAPRGAHSRRTARLSDSCSTAIRHPPATSSRRVPRPRSMLTGPLSWATRMMGVHSRRGSRPGSGQRRGHVPHRRRPGAGVVPGRLCAKTRRPSRAPSHSLLLTAPPSLTARRWRACFGSRCRACRPAAPGRGAADGGLRRGDDIVDAAAGGRDIRDCWTPPRTRPPGDDDVRSDRSISRPRPGRRR